MDRVDCMRAFVATVGENGFAAAARLMGVPRSKVSKQIQALEEAIGVQLLQRTTRKLSLTEVGEAYLRHCQAMRESAQAAADTVAQVQTTPRGTIRVSCPVTLAQTVVAELMPRFLAQYPEVRIDMLVSNRAVNLVEEGIDVALRVRPSVDDSGSMVVKRLDHTTQILVASPELLIRQGPALLRYKGVLAIRNEARTLANVSSVSPVRRRSDSSSIRPVMGRFCRPTMRATCSASAALLNRPSVICGSNGGLLR